LEAGCRQGRQGLRGEVAEAQLLEARPHGLVELLKASPPSCGGRESTGKETRAGHHAVAKQVISHLGVWKGREVVDTSQQLLKLRPKGLRHKLRSAQRDTDHRNARRRHRNPQQLRWESGRGDAARRVEAALQWLDGEASSEEGGREG
jgi:hypothetical protein